MDVNIPWNRLQGVPFLLNIIQMASLELYKEAALGRKEERVSGSFSLRFKAIGPEMDQVVLTEIYWQERR